MTLTSVHRDSDGEVVGYLSCSPIDERSDRDHSDDDRSDDRCGDPESSLWWAHAVFGGRLRHFATRAQAAAYLREHGLAVLAERWWYRNSPTSAWRPTFLIEATLGRVLVRFGYDPATTEVAVLQGTDLDRLRQEPEL